MATQSSVAMNAVTTMNKNQCVDAMIAGDANDMQIMPNTWKNEEERIKWHSHLFPAGFDDE